jgi:hypothetical protein
MQHIVFPRWHATLVDGEEPPSSERRSQRARARFHHPGAWPAPSYLGKSDRVIDAGDCAVIGDDPVADVTVAVIGERVQDAQQESVRGLYIGQLPIKSQDNLHCRPSRHELHVHLTPADLVNLRYAGADGATDHGREDFGVYFGFGMHHLVHSLGAVGKSDQLDQESYGSAGERSSFVDA